MLLLMRREGEILRINENVTVEIKQISEDTVEFQIEGISDIQITLKDTETQDIK